MRRWIFRILIVAFLWFLAGRIAEIEKLAGILAQGKWLWIAIAFLLQVLYHIVYTGLYQSAFSTVNVRSRWRDLWPVVFGSLFINVVAPAGGTSGAALFIDDASKRGESSARATAGALLVAITEFGTFIAILIVGMCYLFTQHDLKSYEIIGAVMLIGTITSLSGVLLVGLWRPDWVRRLLSLLQGLLAKLANLLRRQPFLDKQWAETTSSEFTEAAGAIRQRPSHLARTFAIALGAHSIDLICLFTIFLAFNQSVTFGALVAGYSMAILFWIVSPTPQGVGVVEAVTAMVFASLGVPGSKALVIALAFRGLTFWLPLLVGIIVLRKVRSFRTEQRTQAKVAEVHLVAILTALVGVINVVSSVTPSIAYRVAIMKPFISSAVRHNAHLAAALAGFGLILLSRGLWRRKRVAWIIAMTLLVISLASHLTKGLDYEEAVIVAALAMWLWSLRSHYHSLSDRPSVKQGLTVFAGAVLFTLFYGTIGFYLLDRHFSVNYSLWDSINQTLTMFFEFYDPGLEPVTHFGHYFANSIYVVGTTTLGWSLILLLRPVFIRQPATEAEREHALNIVKQYGRSSLAALALLPDKSYFFSSGGSVIAFAARSGIGLALGDPIGPESDAYNAISEFRKYCEAHDWRPAFYQTLPDHLDLYQSQRFNTICIGHEAIVHLADFTLEGGAVKPIRTSVNKLTKLGFRAEVHNPPILEPLMEELRMVSDAWLTMMQGSEKRFSLGWFDEDYIGSCPVMVIRSDDGTAVAFANIYSEYQLNEATVDLMRRTKDAPNGTMDFLFVSLFDWAKSAGYDTFNLGLSPLAGVGDESDDPIVEKGINFVYKHANRFYGFIGLHAFKEKFNPEWSPRYLVYDGARNLLTTAYSIVSADSGESLIRSHLRRRGQLKVKG